MLEKFSKFFLSSFFLFLKMTHLADTLFHLAAPLTRVSYDPPDTLFHLATPLTRVSSRVTHDTRVI